MKTMGVSRKIDDLGRLVVPAEIRRRFGLTEGAHVDIRVDGEEIVLSKVEESCIFCGALEQLRNFRARKVCTPCITQLTT